MLMFSNSFMRNGIAAIILLLANCSFVLAQAQPYTQNSVITGQCSSGYAKDPGCVLPNVFGPNGLTLPNTSHFAHFSGSAVDVLNQTLSTAIATQLVTLPLISPSSGYTFKYDRDTGTFQPTTTSFGPIYTERAETVGRGTFAFGVDYQRFRFSSIDGIDLHKIPSVFAHQQEEIGGIFPSFEKDVITAVNSISLNMDQTTIYGTVGLTNRIDVSLALPIVSVRMNATSTDTIVRVSGLRIHSFSPTDSNDLYKSYAASGSLGGIGDITIRGKVNVLQTDAWRMALALDLRTPTGNARAFTGAGAIGWKPFVAISKPSIFGWQRVSPHSNIGYQWNGKSILAGNITGTTFGEDANGNPTFTNGSSTKGSLPGFFFYSFGADVGATKRLTLAFDYLGQLLFDAPRVFQTSYVTQPFADGTGSKTFPNISGGKDNIGLNNGSVGMKLNIYGNLLLTANLLFRLDDKGLRQDVTPLIGLSYAFR
jgi:hypothetical protein